MNLWVAGKVFRALLDTGATKSYISDDLARFLESNNIKPVSTKAQTILADGSTSILNHQYAFTFEVDQEILSTALRNLTECTMHEHALFGMDLLKRLGHTLSKRPEPCSTLRYIRPDDSCKLDEVIEDLKHWFTSQQPKNIFVCGLTSRSELTGEEEEKLSSTLNKILPEFVKLPSASHITEHVIKMKHQRPLKQRYYPRNQFMKSVINEQLIANNQIEKSDSPYSSPL